MNKFILFTGVLLGMLIILTCWEYCSTDMLHDGAVLLPNNHHVMSKVDSQSVAQMKQWGDCDTPTLRLPGIKMHLQANDTILYRMFSIEVKGWSGTEDTDTPIIVGNDRLPTSIIKANSRWVYLPDYPL